MDQPTQQDNQPTWQDFGIQGAAQPAAQPASNRNRNIGLGCAGLIAVCLVCALCGNLINANGGSTSATPDTSATSRPGNTDGGSTNAQAREQTPSPTRKPQPTATLNPNRGLDAYRTAVDTNGSILSGDLDIVGTDCQAGDVSACHDDLQALDTDIQAFQRDLKAHPAPPCLHDADTNLQKALGLYDQGAQQAIAGIEQNDAALIRQGTDTMSQGTTYLGLATAAIQKASC